MNKHRRFRWGVVAVTSALVTLAACGGEGGSESNDQTTATLRLAVGTVPRGLDPHLGQSVSEVPYVNMVFDTLTYVDANREIQPMLATEWEFTEDGSQLIMKLRDDVTFNDGSPLTADAVKASIERGQTLEGSTVAGLLEPIESVEVLGDFEVAFNVTSGAASLPAVFALPAGAVINPKVIAAGHELHLNPPRGAGSGAYVLDSLHANEKATFARADDAYWDPEAGQADRFEITTVQDEQARIAGFQSGAFDLAFVRQQVDAAERLVDQGKAKIYNTTSLTQFGLFFRNDRSVALRNREVRQAINMTIDRRAMADELMQGYCEPTVQFWPKGDPLHIDELDDLYPYDREAARRKLAEANVGNLSLEIINDAGLWPPEDMAQVVQNELTGIGVNVKVRALEASVAGPEYAAGKFDAYLDAISASASPILHIQNTLLGGQGDLIGDPPAELLDLLDDAKDQTRTEEERQEALRELSRRVTEDAWYAPICNGVTTHIADPDITGVDEMSWTWGFLWEARYLGAGA